MRPLAEDLWVLRHPLKLLGGELGRTVTAMRLDGKLLIHSTADFSPADVQGIRALGTPAWLLDATLVHDTCSKAGRTALPEAAYHAPPGFPAKGMAAPLPLTPPPSPWSGVVDVLEIQGAPIMREHVFLHRPSRTLILADLIFHLPVNMGAWTRFLFRSLSGLKAGVPAVSRLVRMAVKDKAAFAASVQQMLAWDFDRVIVGHGDIIERDGKAVIAPVLKAAAR
jgi:hypothetical protein